MIGCGWLGCRRVGKGGLEVGEFHLETEASSGRWKLMGGVDV